jgi:hypothetical protein
MQEQYIRLKWAEAPKSLRHAKSMRKKIARFIEFKSKVSDLLGEHKHTLAEGRRPKAIDRDFFPFLSEYNDFRKTGRHIRGPLHVYARAFSMSVMGVSIHMSPSEMLDPINSGLLSTALVVSAFTPEMSALAYATGKRIVAKFHSPEATVGRHVLKLPKSLEGRELERAKAANLKSIEEAIAHNDKLIAAHQSKLGELEEFIANVEAEKKERRKAMFNKLLGKLIPARRA